MKSADELLQFWFGPLHGGFATAEIRRRWFAAAADFDRRIAQDYSALLEAAARGDLDSWRDSPRDCLALILLTDQCSRQIHRGTARAFATDSIALACARHGIAHGFDTTLAIDERAFFYMPFEHSELLADQNRAVALFSALVEAAPVAQRHLVADTLRFAEHHRDIIAQFGRFPHRNSIVGRPSTEAELAFLATASRFGQ
jgi:uncharacterized protein (DUF924 family)